MQHDPFAATSESTSMSICSPTSINGDRTVIIVGGGLVGALAALYMANRGYHVKVYEKRSDIRKNFHSINDHKSINLALSIRGLKALERVNADDDIIDSAIPMVARMIHPKDGLPCTVQSYGDYGESINSVDRKFLNYKLLDYAEATSQIELFFNQELLSLDPDACSLVFQDKKSERDYTVQGDFILGCDGAYSTVRRELLRKEPIDFSQSYMEHGYKELCIPSGPGGVHQLASNCLHIWPRKQFMLIALPNQDGSFTVTLFYPFEQLQSLVEEDAVLTLFKENFSDALELIGASELLRQFFTNPVGSLVNVQLSKYHYRDKILLLGDAAHAMVPFYGQGMNAGFEDCLVLDELLDQYRSNDGIGNDNLALAFEKYSQTRRVDAHSICNLAIENYYEMSTAVESPLFTVRSKIASWLHLLFPKQFIPQYSMVAFTTIPYSEVVRRRNVQNRIITALLGGSALLTISSICIAAMIGSRICKWTR